MKATNGNKETSEEQYRREQVRRPLRCAANTHAHPNGACPVHHV